MADAPAPAAAPEIAARFGIGEWFGHSFVNTTAEQRREYARIALSEPLANYPPCPFKAADGTQRCTKKGGICSLRLYERFDAAGAAVATATVEGDLRAVCPHRFKQGGTIYREIGRSILGTTEPRIVDEVRFLQRPRLVGMAPAEENEDAAEPEVEQEDVGNIDNVLVHPDADPLRWCALEIQAVYFSGKGMKSLFEHIRDCPHDALPFPDLVRRPDYRSSGPKRLMPQLQIKVPTLRRWGKRMAVVVDAAWFRTNVINVETVADLSNCDIAWFVVRFDEATDPATIIVGEPEKQTLERAVEGLTGGFPVTLADFEQKMMAKLNEVARRRGARRR